MACPPLRGAEGRGHPQGPASASTTHFLSVLFFFFAASSSEVAVEFFSLFVSFGPKFVPSAHARSYFWCCIVSLLEERCVPVQAPQQRPGPRASRLQTSSKFRHLDLGQLACFITMEQ